MKFTIVFNVLSVVVFSFVYCEDMTVDVRSYFPGLDDDMSKVTWVHRCNSKGQLESALNSDVMMIEVDIVLGHLEGVGGGPPLPIMGHPPETTSDLSLEQFLDMVLQKKANKGIKLDFKSLAVFKASENILEQFLAKSEVDFPVWVNADIVQGPGHPAGREVVEPTYFLRACVDKFPLATISAGWTVNGSNAQNLRYNSTNIDEMTALLVESNVLHPVTFPVHAGIAANSLDSLVSLIHSSVAGTSLTLWAAEGDWVDYGKLRELITSVGKDRVFVDLPQGMKDALQSDPVQEGSASLAVPSLALLLLTILYI